MAVNSFNDLVSRYYDIINGNVENPEDAEYICLCEEHSYPYRKINSLFLNAVMTPEDVSLVETTESMQSPEDNLQTCFLKTDHVFGWDINPEKIFKYQFEKSAQEDAVRSDIILHQLISVAINDEERKHLEVEMSEIIQRQIGAVKSLPPQFHKRKLKHIRDTFNKRTNSMIKTCNRVHSNFRRKFLLAGKGHFINFNSFQEANPQVPSNIDQQLILEYEAIRVEGNTCSSRFIEYLKEKRFLILSPKEDLLEEIYEKVNILVIKLLQGNF